MLLARTPAATRLRWQAVSVGAGLLLVIAAMILSELTSKFIQGLNLYLQDGLMMGMTQQRLPSDFVFLDFDEKTLSADDLEPEWLSESRPLQLIKSEWPWSREIWSAVGEKLIAAGAKLVIFDVLLPTPRPGDEALIETLRRHPGKIVMSSSFGASRNFQDNADAPSLVLPSRAFLDESEGVVGLVNLNASKVDGKIRRLFVEASASTSMGKEPFDGEDFYPSLATVSAKLLGNPPEGNPKPLRFRYSKPDSAAQVSLYEIFVPKFWELNFKNGDFFKDRVVIIGSSAERLHDIYPTPAGRMPGPEIQLHALAAMLRGQWLGQPGDWADWLTVFLSAAAAFGIIMIRRNIAWFIMALIGGVLVWLFICAASLAVFSYFLPMAPPMLTWLVCGFAGLACDVTLERRERGRLRGTLERYVSKDLVREIVENPGVFLQSLGQRKEIVALFSDLQGFTADTERLDPGEMVALLNEYFTEMVKAIFGHHGTNDKFIGDAIMATWGCIGASTPEEDACRAVAAAVEMKERLAKLNEARKIRGSVQWTSGIGICQGQAIFGDMGSEEKMDITVIGDTVNLASRIEGLTRIYKCGILVNERVAENAREKWHFLFVDEVRVKGRKQTEKLFSPYLPSDAAWAEAFTAARGLYLAGDFLAARDAFGKLSQGGLAPALATCFMTRCEGFFRVLPEPGWDGVWDFLEK